MKKKTSSKLPATQPLTADKKGRAGRTAKKQRNSAPANEGFSAVWLKLLPRLSARFKNPEVFREAYQRLFHMGFKPAPAPQDKRDFDFCNVLCGHWEINKPLPIQVSFEPMHNGLSLIHI